MATASDYERDDLGPEQVLMVYNPETGMRGVVVVDCAVLGPCGGGTRMAPDLELAEVAALARSMTYKFGILGLPRGGSKAGIWGYPGMDPAKKRAVMRAFGRRIQPLLAGNFVAVGPDMGITVADVAEMYQGAGIENARTGLFSQIVDGDPAAYHLTGYGVVTSAGAALGTLGRSLDGARIAIEGFGQAGTGTARYAAKAGANVVAISTLSGAIYNASGLDIPRLIELRRTHGDACVLEYRNAERLSPSELYYVPADVLVPGARPWVIHDDNYGAIQAKVIVSAGNITVRPSTQDHLFRKGILSVPDFVSNSGAAISSWVDFLAGNFEQALKTVDRMITAITTDVLVESKRSGVNPYVVATERVRQRIAANRGKPRKSFEETKADIRQLFGL